MSTAKSSTSKPIVKAKPATHTLTYSTQVHRHDATNPVHVYDTTQKKWVNLDLSIADYYWPSLSDPSAIEIIRAGMPIVATRCVSDFYEISPRMMYEMLALPYSTAARIEKKSGKISPPATERVLRIANVTKKALEVFGEEELVRKWMLTPNRSLGNATPMSLLDTQPGEHSVNLVLNAIQTGGAA